MWLLLTKFSLHYFYNIICINSMFTWTHIHLDIPVLMLPVFCKYCALLVETKPIQKMHSAYTVLPMKLFPSCTCTLFIVCQKKT